MNIVTNILWHVLEKLSNISVIVILVKGNFNETLNR